MRETTGRSSRVSTKLKAALVALFSIFAFAAVSASSAQAADQLDVTFNDAWIKIPALEALGLEPIHALDPTDGQNLKVNIKGDLNKSAGTFTSKASDFTFPTQTFEVTPGNNVNLVITANSDFNGAYNSDSGAFSASLPLKLTVDAAGFEAKCELAPLTIPLSSSGAAINFAVDGDPPNNKAGAAFAPPSNNGAANGSWTNVTADQNVTGVAAYGKDQATMTADCKSLIEGLAGGSDVSFDGSIWLGGTSKVTHTEDPVCTPPQTGNKPNCIDPPIVEPEKSAEITKVAITPAKGKIKAGKSLKIKVKVTNTGNEASGPIKVSLKSTNKQVKLPKSVGVDVAAGATVTKTVTVKASKKAKGKATITAKYGSKSGKSVLTVKKAKKKKKK